jgi:DNA invertase Pin-like site-specific DNA recombinase
LGVKNSLIVHTIHGMKRAVLYLRVSTIDQTTANQERELREIAGRIGCEITKIYKDHGISDAKAETSVLALMRSAETPPSASST